MPKTYTVITPKSEEKIHTCDSKYLSLETMQRIVGGHIEFVALRKNPGNVMIVNEEGKLHGLPFNAKASIMSGHEIVGDVIVCDESLLEGDEEDDEEEEDDEATNTEKKKEGAAEEA